MSSIERNGLTESDRDLLAAKQRSVRVRSMALGGCVFLIVLGVVLMMVMRPGLTELEVLAGCIAAFVAVSVLGSWYGRARRQLRATEFSLGTTMAVQLLHFEPTGDHDSEGQRVTMTILEPHRRTPSLLASVHVPTKQKARLFPGATIVLQTSATNPEDRCVHWEATAQADLVVPAPAGRKKESLKGVSSGKFKVACCSNCGAPLRPEGTSQSVSCDYCGEINIVVPSAS